MSSKRNSKFKKGDLVKIREWDDLAKSYANYERNDDMLRLPGNIAFKPISYIEQQVKINPYFLTRGDTLKNRCMTKGSQISGEC